MAFRPGPRFTGLIQTRRLLPTTGSEGVLRKPPRMLRSERFEEQPLRGAASISPSERARQKPPAPPVAMPRHIASPLWPSLSPSLDAREHPIYTSSSRMVTRGAGTTARACAQQKGPPCALEILWHVVACLIGSLSRRIARQTPLRHVPAGAIMRHPCVPSPSRNLWHSAACSAVRQPGLPSRWQ